MSTPAATWPAPVATRPLDATVDVPGSKSLTNRYLLLGAIAAEETLLRQPLHSRDTELMAGALRALGTEVHTEPGGDWRVVPGPLTGPARIECGLAGTVMRFVPAIAALADGEVHLDGDARARERPIGPVLDALRELGAQIDDDGRRALPLTIHGTGHLPGGAVDVDASASSQFVSALLLAGARYDDGLDLSHTGVTAPSMPHIAMTVQVLRERGVAVEELAADGTPATSTPTRWRVAPGPVAGGEIVVEPDLSNAGPFLAAALAVGGTVRVPRWPARTTQAGDAYRRLLTAMGGEVQLVDDVLEVRGTGELRGLDVDLHDVGELTPTIAALAALASTPSQLRGIAHLRGHETDRLAALVTEINRLGGQATETEDGLTIEPVELHGGVVETYHDHRMATFGAILGLRVPGVEVRDVATTSKTLPDFAGMWTRMLGLG